MSGWKMSDEQRERLDNKVEHTAHVEQDRFERGQNLLHILGEEDVALERIARFITWADVHASDQRDIAVRVILGEVESVVNEALAEQREAIARNIEAVVEVLTGLHTIGALRTDDLLGFAKALIADAARIARCESA